MNSTPFPMARLKVLPLAQRDSLCRIEDVLRDPASTPPPCPDSVRPLIERCARQILEARVRDASVMLIYGAHLLRNGAALILEQMMVHGWITHLATNGAGTIHDWEFAFQGRSTESVRKNVLSGTFGTWDETGRNIHLALLAGGLRGEGYGRALGRFIFEDGVILPTIESLEQNLRHDPSHPLAPAFADLLQTMIVHQLRPGQQAVSHPWKHASVLSCAYRHGVPMTVHPGIGYDIITNHPLFNGAAIGRAAGVDFRYFASAVEQLDHGVVLSVGSAIMGPQVFEKSVSCVNNLRQQENRPTLHNHSIYVVDLQDGGQWDWTQGEPPKTNPAYYLRFCKSYARMGGAMHYACMDNMAFMHGLYHELLKESGQKP